MAEQSAFLRLENVSKTFPGVNALSGVGFDVRRGEVHALIGENGAGKSTLIKVLTGVYQPDPGAVIEIEGQRVDRMTQSELILFRQKHIGFIFQSFNLMPYYTALENVALPLVFRGINKSKRNKLAKDALVSVGLETHMRHKPTQMSGGQQQRVAIARALVTDPRIIFADEPTGNLDSKTSDEVMHMITRIARERGKTLIMVTHDPNMAAFTDKAIHLLDGLITEIAVNNNPIGKEFGVAQTVS